MERDSMRRFPNGKPGQSRCGLSAAFSRSARSFRLGWRRIGSRSSDLLWRRPLAGCGGLACESQGNRGAQRSDAGAGHRSGETLPRRVRAGNLADPFHGACRNSGRDGHSLRGRGSLQHARFDSRRRAGGSHSRPRATDCEYRRRNQSRGLDPCSSEGPSSDFRHDKSPHPPRSLALAQTRSWPGPGHCPRRFRRSLRSTALVAKHERCSRCGARSLGSVERLGGPASASSTIILDLGGRGTRSGFALRAIAPRMKAGEVLPHAKRRILEKEKAFAAWRRHVFYFWNVRQLSPFEGRERIIVEQRTRLLFAKPIDNQVVRRLQTKWTGSRIVRVAGHEMNESLGDPPQCILLRTGAETASQRASSHLGKASLAYPFFQALRPRTQNRIALRVGDHGLHAGELNRVQRLVHRGRDRKLVEFNEQEIALIDAKLPGVLAQGFEILRVEMKITAGGDAQPLADFCLQL